MLIYDTFHRPRLRVMAVTPGLDPGGAEVWLSTLYRHAQSVRYTAIVSVQGPSQLSDRFAGTNIYFADSTDETHIAETIRRAFKKCQCDLIMYWGFRPLQIGDLGVPVVHVMHASGVEPTNQGHFEYQWKWGKSYANFLTSVCASGVEVFSDSLRSRENVAVIHNGADVERTRPIRGREWQREQWQVPEEAKVMLYVGRFCEGKGHDVALKSLRLLPEEWHLVLHGWGKREDSAAIKEAAAREFSSKLAPSRVFFPQPRLDHLGDVYAAADCVVIPSHSEAFPLVMIEAWHAGVPLVCSEFQTLHEVEGVYNEGAPLAWHVPCPPSPADVATAVQQATLNDQRVMDAASIAFQHFTASAMVGRWETYFYDCVRQWHEYCLRGLTQVAPPKEDEDVSGIPEAARTTVDANRAQPGGNGRFDNLAGSQPDTGVQPEANPEVQSE